MRPKNKELMDAILHCIDEYQSRYGASPSTREIAEFTGSDCGSISRYLSYMEQQGLLERKGTRSIETKKSKARSGMVCVPLVGSIACGNPILADEDVEEYIPVPAEYASGEDFFFLRAKGSSMVNAGIDDGDLVLIRRQNTARKGQIIVAIIDNEEATLKRYYPEKRKVVLQPENDDFVPIEIDPHCCRFLIQGVAISVTKSIA